MVSFSVHVSHAYVTTDLSTEQYNFNFAILDISIILRYCIFRWLTVRILQKKKTGFDLLHRWYKICNLVIATLRLWKFILWL